MWALSAHSTFVVILVPYGLEPHISLSPCNMGSRWDGASSGDKARGSTSRCTGPRFLLDGGQSTIPPCSTNTRAGGPAADHLHRLRQGGSRRLPPPPPPAPANIIGDLVDAPTAFTHFRTSLGAVQAQGAFTGFEVCLLACLLFL